ncbi:MAG: hypothetical protein IKB07_07300 [Lachnospiraceae bacterium]|nr:hypothetical protein [Lachnospiraceae bacterium]
MAKIKSFVKGTGSVSTRMSEVECVYNVGDVNGEKYIALSTYGSSGRQNGGVASQVIHMNREKARELVEILNREFGL